MNKIILKMLVLGICCLSATAALADPPANDDCANAIAVGEVTELPYSTQEASFDGEGYCMDSPNIWYVYTPSFSGNIRITLDADYEAKLAVYNGASCSPLPNELGCSADGYFGLAVSVGNQYLIEVGGIGYNIGDGLLTIGEAQDSPPNDNCIDADDAGTLIDGLSVQLTGTVAGATLDCESVDYPEAWVKFAIADYMHVTIDFCDNPTPIDMYSASMVLYQDCPCGDYEYYDQTSYCPNTNISFTWQYLPAGTYYYPIIKNYMLTGPYVVNITGVASAIPPTGACCADAGMTCVANVTQDSCFALGGNWRGEDTECGTFDEETGWSGCYTPEPTGACCINGGMGCIDGTTNAECYEMYFGEYKGDGSFCGEPDPETGIYEGCQESTTGACCLDGGLNCVDGVTESDCYEMYFGEYKGNGSFCGEPDPGTGIYEGCQEPTTGACCLDGGLNCVDGVTESDCYEMYFGEYKGDGSFCGEPDPETGIYEGCNPPQTGACCQDGGMICAEMTEAECYNIEGDWKGIGTTCGTYDPETGYEGCNPEQTYNYLPGDVNMSGSAWPPLVTSPDVTYLVNFFRGLPTSQSCLLDGFWCSADANGDCSIISSDVTKLVNVFRGISSIGYCADYSPVWLTPADLPAEVPLGWPNCEE